MKGTSNDLNGLLWYLLLTKTIRAVVMYIFGEGYKGNGCGYCSLCRAFSYWGDSNIELYIVTVKD